MSWEESLYSDLEIDEGKKTNRYKDIYGNWSIGVGHNLKAYPIPGNWEIPLSDEHIRELLIEDSNRLLAPVKLQSWFNALDDVRKRVVGNMIFNMGWRAFGQFKTLISKLKDGKYPEAAESMLKSEWAKQLPERSKRLANSMRSGKMDKYYNA
jgi:lysozyme